MSGGGGGAFLVYFVIILHCFDCLLSFNPTVFQLALSCICNPQVGSHWVNDEKAFSLTGTYYYTLTLKS